jgi:hypothetical protein
VPLDPAYCRHRPELPGNVDIFIGSALTPVLESVDALPAYQAGHPADLPVTEISMIELAEERMKLWVVWILPNWNLFGSYDWVIGAF